jgi:hypothetical protein
MGEEEVEEEVEEDIKRERRRLLLREFPRSLKGIF